jgi:N utilization substance protein B
LKERRAARRLALDVLYEAEIRGMTPIETFRERQQMGWSVDNSDGPEIAPAEQPSDEALAYARRLVAGVEEHLAEMDAVISRCAEHWALERMPVIDRNLIRLALFELRWLDDVPVPVAINEAVELAKMLSTDGSGRFVNGLLGRIAEEGKG